MRWASKIKIIHQSHGNRAGSRFSTPPSPPHDHRKPRYPWLLHRKTP
jgi:hypothetical protein